MIKEYIEGHVEPSDNITLGGEFESQS
jgi:hypothetical protein